MKKLNTKTISDLSKAILISVSFLIAVPVTAETVVLPERLAADVTRDVTSKPTEIMEFVGVTKGDHVLDFLGGGGYYSQLLKGVVGDEGAVVLQNNQAYIKYVGEELTKKDTAGALAGVTQLVSEADDLKLGEAQFDIVFWVLGFHDVFFTDDNWAFDPDVALPQLAKSLKLGGKLLIIDHQSAAGRGMQDAQKLHRIEDAFVTADLAKRGFKLVRQSSILRSDNDDYAKTVFDPSVRRKTDRFVMLFELVE
jgi:predicted methyltransferase